MSFFKSIDIVHWKFNHATVLEKIDFKSNFKSNI